MDQTAERPQSPEIEKVPFLRIGFLGRDAGFLRIRLEDLLGQNKISSVYDLSCMDFKRRIKRMREANQDIPQIVITDKISPKEAEELNSQEISLIVINQNGKKDLSFLTSENPQRKVSNKVITVESIDAAHMGALLPEVIGAINDLIQPK